jgi:hypothetical protein
VLQHQAAEAAPQAANGKAGSKAAAKAPKVWQASFEVVAHIASLLGNWFSR